MFPRKLDVKTSTLQKYLAAALSTITILWILIILCVPAMENFLVIDRPLPHADAVVVMAGEKSLRLPAAAKLYREKKADMILLTNDGIFSSWSNEKQRNLYEVEWAEQGLMEMGVPQKAIVKLPYTASGSIHDALNTREYLLNSGIKNIVIVTSDYHSRRSLWIFEQVYRNYPLRIGVYPVSTSPVHAPIYGKFMSLAVEMIKCLYYRLKYSST